MITICRKRKTTKKKNEIVERLNQPVNNLSDLQRHNVLKYTKKKHFVFKSDQKK